MIEGILQYEFLRNSFLTGMIVGVIAPLLGVFIVVRRLSLIADALSHVTLAGIAANLLIAKRFAFFAGISPLYMGTLFSVGGALLIEKLRGDTNIFKNCPSRLYCPAALLWELFLSLWPTDLIRICSAICLAASAP